MSAIALSIRGLRKSFARGLARCTRRTVAISGVDLDLYQSEIVGLSGAEGAGKTTLLQCASGLLRPDAGSVIARHVVAYVPAIPIYYPFLTVRDVISLRASRVSIHGTSVTEQIIDLLELAHVRNDIIAALSPSELIRLSIAEAVTGTPSAIMIDTNGSGSVIECASVKRTLDRVASSGIAVMIASRDHHVLETMARRVIQLNEGRLVPVESAPLFVAERLH